WRAIRFPGEAYAARVSSFNGGFSNVSLRFLAIGGGSVTPSGVTVTLNANGGSVNPSSIVRTPGSTYGSAGSLPTPTRSGRLFVDWFNTSSTVGGTRIRNNSTVSNSNHTLFARWTDPSRHDNRWWLPSNLGTTVIPIRIAGNPAVNWRTGIQNGVANWNSTNTAIDFRFDDNAIDRVSASIWPYRFYGRVRLFHSGTTVVGFDIDVNTIEISHSRTLTNHTSQGIINFTTSVMVHELGHILGLRDGPSGSPVGGGVNNSIMNYGRNRNTLLRPTSFDITGVNMIYN
ncbi:MAG: InlB B-repeat-containing protein, partial [Defluviitaleaceae bacterium]|nr:InlB B-repeat-containing protein [Defluviitaleaceae bacterium]